MPAYSVTEYLKLEQKAEVWLWDGIVPVSGAALLFAAQKIGKSFLALSLAEAVADEDIAHYLGQSIGLHGPVLYIQLDTPRGLWIKNYLKNLKSEKARNSIYIMDREMDDVPMPFDIRTRECQLWVKSEIDRIKPVLVIIDTMRRMHRCKENDNDEMAIIYDVFVNLTTPAAMLILTHQAKNIQEGQEAKARGASSVAGAVDCLIHMTKKRLKFEARSDIDEELKIFQTDDGTFTTHDQAEAADELIDNLTQKGLKFKEIDSAVAEKFGVSARTARRWRVKD